MNVGELIKELSSFSPETEVLYYYDSDARGAIDWLSVSPEGKLVLMSEYEVLPEDYSWRSKQ